MIDDLVCEFCQNIFDIPELRNHTRIFRDRKHAGIKLSSMLGDYEDSDAIVFGIPAGGVPVAAPMARRLKIALDVAVVSKITLPWNNEVGYGAIAFDKTLELNEDMISRMGLTQENIEEDINKAYKKVQNRFKLFREEKPFPELSNRPAILVDDGIASGFTMMVAVETLKNKGAGSVIIAVPTAHLQALERISSEVDRIYCANVRGGGAFAVADAYKNWYDVEEKEVTDILKDF